MNKIKHINRSSFIISVTLFSVIIFIAGYFYYNYERQSLYNIKYQELKNISNFKSEQISKYIKTQVSIANIVSSSLFLTDEVEKYFNNPFDISIKNSIVNHLKDIVDEFGLDNAILTDTNGKIMLSVKPGEKELDEYAVSKVNEAVNSKEIILSDLYFCKLHKEIHFDYITPLIDEQTNVLANLIFRSDPENELFPLINDNPGQNNSLETILLRKEKDSVLFINNTRFNNNAAFNLKIPLSRIDVPSVNAAFGLVGNFEGTDYRNKKVLSEIRRMTNPDWIMITKIDKSEINSELLNKFYYILAICFGLVFSVSFGFIWIYNQRQKNIYEELYKKETELWQQQEKFKVTLDNMLEGCMLIDYNWKYLYVNDSAAKHGQQKRENLIGKSMLEMYSGVEKSEIFAGYKHCMDNRISSQYESSYTFPDGTINWFLISVQPVPEGIFVLSLDITERKKSSEQLQKISTAIEQTADSVMITDKNGFIEYINSAFLKTTGYSREEVIGKTPHILKSGRHPESFYKDFWEKILKGNTYRTKFINCKKNGELYIIERTVTPVENESGEITHFISTGRDVTEKERIEDELNKNSKLLQSFFQYSITPFVLLDKDFNFLLVNEQYAKACQRDISEFIGRNHFEFYPSDAKTDFEKVVNTKEAVRFIERPFVFPDHPEWGVTYWNWSLTPILDKMGEVEFLVFTLKDVTQQKRAIDEIKSSHKRLRTLYAHLQKAREEERTRIAREIHDSIGQGLTGLKMDLSLLENELAQQKDLSEREKLYGKIQTMYTLLDDMIQSVRDVSAQLRPLILDSLGLVTAIEWQTEEFQKKTGLTCEYILPKEKVELNSDESTVLFRILQECLTNIIRHAKATKVIVKLERKEKHILLEVQDNGIGIEENVVKEINSLGLLGMKERALVFGGSVDICGKPRNGTIVTVKIPKE